MAGEVGVRQELLCKDPYKNRDVQQEHSRRIFEQEALTVVGRDHGRAVDVQKGFGIFELRTE